MSGTNSNPASAPLPNPLVVDPSSRPKVHAGVFYLVAGGSAKEALLTGVGATFVSGAFDGSTLTGLSGGATVESVTVTAFDADPDIDGATGQYVYTEMAGNSRVFIPTGMSISWSLLETFATGDLVDIVKIGVQGEAHAIVNYTVRD